MTLADLTDLHHGLRAHEFIHFIVRVIALYYCKGYQVFFSWIEVIVPYLLTVIPQCFTNILTFLENCDLPPAV